MAKTTEETIDGLERHLVWLEGLVFELRCDVKTLRKLINTQSAIPSRPHIDPEPWQPVARNYGGPYS